MRYLGDVAKLSKLKHVTDLCITEILARTLKRFFNTACSNLILKAARDASELIQIRKQLEELRFANEHPSSQATMLKQRAFESRSA